MTETPTSAEEVGGLRRLVRSRWALGLLIVAATAAAYSNSFRGPFIFDDLDSIPNNATIRHLWPLGPVLSPPSGGGITVAGRPVINLSLALNYAISGTSVWSYHALNLLVHILASLTLWAIVRRTLRLPLVPERWRASADGLATAAALLWAVHPLATSAVTYIIQRAESIMALCYLLTLYCVIRAADSRRSVLWYIGAVAAAACGMASKEVMVTVPLMVLLYDRTFLARSFRHALRRRWGLYVGLAATWLILAALWGGRATSAGFGGPVGAWPYACMQFDFVARYLGLCFWPHPLILDYGARLASGIRPFLPAAALVTGLVFATVIALRLRPWLGFLGAWVFLILAPSSSLVPVSTQTGAEHRMYLPLAGVVVLAVLAGHWLWRHWATRVLPRPTWRTWIGGLLLIGLAGALGTVTFLRNRDYRSAFSIWADTVASCPGNPRAHYNLAQVLTDGGQYAQAEEQLLITVRQKPDHPDAYMNLGCIHAKLGRHEAAIADFGRALQVFPDRADNYFNRGNSYFALGRFEQAIDDANEALQRDPAHAAAYYARGMAQQKLMRTEEAVASYTQAIRLKSDYAAAYGERAISYYFLRRYDDAWADVRRFRELGGTPNPGFIERLSQVSGRHE